MDTLVFHYAMEMEEFMFLKYNKKELIDNQMDYVLDGYKKCNIN